MAQRTAHLDLDWTESHSTSPSGYDYVQYTANLPHIPGYKDSFHVSVLEQRHLPLSDVPYYGFVVVYDGLPDPVGTVSNEDFGIPDSDSAEEMMQAVENLSPQEIADALTAIGDVPLYGDDFAASRSASIEHGLKEGKHMIRKSMKRTAGMSLDWEELGSDKEGWHEYWSLLPDIPGYPYADGFQGVVTVADTSDDGDDGPFVDGVFPEETDWGFDMSLGLVAGDGRLTNDDFGIPDTDTAEEMMDIVDNLSVQDIADVLQAKGYGPGDNTVGSRQASHRIASLDLDWEETTDTFGAPLYKAVLPAIPGYPYSGDGNSTVSIGLDDFDTTGETYIWWMDIEVGKNDNVRFSDYELTGMGSSPLDYVMDYLDGLSVEWIADKLAEKGYMPDED